MSFHSGGMSSDDMVRGVILLVTIIACIISAYLIAGRAGIVVLVATPCIMGLGYQGVVKYTQYAHDKRSVISPQEK